MAIRSENGDCAKFSQEVNEELNDLRVSQVSRIVFDFYSLLKNLKVKNSRK